MLHLLVLFTHQYSYTVIDGLKEIEDDVKKTNKEFEVAQFFKRLSGNLRFEHLILTSIVVLH